MPFPSHANPIRPGHWVSPDVSMMTTPIKVMSVYCYMKEAITTIVLQNNTKPIFVKLGSKNKGTMNALSSELKYV